MNTRRMKGFPDRCLWVLTSVAASLLMLAGAAHGGVVEVSGDITADTVWSSADVHVVTRYVTVQAGITLTIQAGAVVKFRNGAGLRVDRGVLKAQGNASEPIVFTSWRDDDHGGDTNADGPSSGAPGDWHSVSLYGAIASQTVFEHVVVRYAGSWGGGGVYVNGTNVPLRFLTVSDGKGHGIQTYNVSSAIEDCVVTGNQGDGLFLQNGAPTVRRSHVEDNGIGVRSQWAVLGLEGNTIVNNRSWGIYFDYVVSAPRITGNTITGNGRPARIPVTAVPVAGDGNVLVPNERNALWIVGDWNRPRGEDLDLGVQVGGGGEELGVYVVEGRVRLTGGAGVTVGAGVVVKFGQDAQLYVEGGVLTAEGTAEALVVFTSWWDDGWGGDTNEDGAGTVGAPDQWRGIAVVGGPGGNVIRHGVVRYAGRWTNEAVYAQDTDLVLEDVEVTGSSKNGVRGYRASVRVVGCEIYGNLWDGVQFEQGGASSVEGGRVYGNFGDGVEVTGGAQAQVLNAEVFGNLGAGVRGSGSQAVKAWGNWWGAVDGPGGDLGGSGDEVAGNVDVDELDDGTADFLTDGSAFGYFDAGPNTGAGTIGAPVVVQGTASSEWGTGAAQTVLYDLDAVVLRYSGLDPAKRYDVIVTYRNGDDTSAIGGNVQRLETGGGDVIHGSVRVGTAVVPRRYGVPDSAYGDGSLELRFVRENGYRAVVGQVWLVERRALGDTTAPSVAMTWPAGGADLAGGEVWIRGTATDGTGGSGVVRVEVGVDGGSGVTWRTVTWRWTDGTWGYRWVLPADGAYTLSVRAWDRAGNVGELGAGVGVVVNQEPPGAPGDVVAYDTPGDAGGSITLEWTLSADDGAGAADVAAYAVERREAGALEFAEVGRVGAGTGAFADTTAVTGVEYEYRVVAEDRAGNRAASGVSGPAAAWDNLGGGDTAAPADVTDLAAVAGNGFVYLRWTPSADSALDLVGYTVSLSPDGGSTWTISVELGKGAQEYLWEGLTNGTAYTFKVQARDSSGNASTGVTVGATPSETAYTTVGGHLNGEVTWAAGVYYVPNWVQVNGVLRILPGVVVKFGDGAYLDVRGRLEAKGTAAAPIAFTAWTDDDWAGDTNGDGASAGAPGYWRNLYFNGSTGSVLEHVVVRYAGKWNYSAVDCYGGTDLVIRGSEIRESLASGVYTNGSSPAIESSRIEGNGGAGFWLESGSPRIAGNVITGNVGDGVHARWSTPRIEGNEITANGGYGVLYEWAVDAPELRGNTVTGNARAVRVPFSSLPGADAGNVISGNGSDAIELWGNRLERNLTLEGGGRVYWQVGGVAEVRPGAYLQVEPGAIWKMGSGARLDVFGALRAVGTDADRIVFTSWRDDEWGGDTDGGGPSRGAPGDWGRIHFGDSAIDFLCGLERVVVRYGGSTRDGSVYLYRANVPVRSSEILEGSAHGVYVNQASPEIAGNVIRGHAWAGVREYSWGGARIVGNRIEGNATGISVSWEGVVRIEDNEILGNRDWGIWFEHAYTVPRITGNTITGNGRPARIPVTAVPVAGDGNVLVPNERNALWIVGDWNRPRGEDLDLGVQVGGGGEELGVYVVEGRVRLTGGAGVTVGTGVVVKFGQDAQLYVEGGVLTAEGTAEAPVVFTSWWDDGWGGDTNEDGAGTVGAPDQWRGIAVVGGPGGNVIRHGVVRYAGRWTNEAVYAQDTDLVLEDVEVTGSSKNGVRGYRASVRVVGCEIYGNLWDGVQFEQGGASSVEGGRVYGNFGDGVEVTGGAQAQVLNAEVFGNLGAGVRGSGSQAVKAWGNWWGAVDGPGGDLGGSGDEVAGNVDVDELDDGAADFLTDGSAFSYFDAGGSGHYGYGIGVPSVTGTPSTEWGGSPAYSVLYDLEDRVIRADYGGLTPGGQYRLLVTYLNRDSGGSTQVMTDLDGRWIHPPLPIAYQNPVLFSFPVPKPSVADGALRLRIQALSGQRAVVAALMLVEVPNQDTTPPSVSLDEPSDGALVRGDRIRVSGTASDGAQPLPRVEIGIAPEGQGPSWTPVHRMDVRGNWEFDWSPADGTYVLTARAVDRAGNEALSPPVRVSVDNTPPAPPTGFTVQEVAGALRSLWILSADDGSGAADVAGYEIRRGTGPIGPFTTVGTVGAGVDRFDDTTVTLGEAYYYVVRAVDAAGNGSDGPVFGPVSATGAVDTTPPEDVTNLTAQPTHVGGASPSVFLRWTASANSEGDLTDQLLYLSADGGNTWGSNAPAFDDGRPVRLGRLRTWYQVTGLALNLPYRFRITVTDEVPNESAGTEVGAEITGDPSETVTLGGGLPASMDLARGVYRVTSTLLVPQGAVLRLGPGTILKFNPGQGLDVRGDLVTQGTPSEPVVLTALADDDHGGDTNGDGPSQGAPGAWAGMIFRNTADPGVSRLEGALVRYAGGWGYGVYLEAVSVPILDSVVELSSGRGIHTYATSPEIRGCKVRNNATDGIYAYQGAPVIEDNEITGNRTGIYAHYAAPAVNRNRVTDNAGYGVYHYDARNAPPMRGNVVTGNDVALAVPMSAFPDASNTVTPNNRKFLVIRGNAVSGDSRVLVWARGTADEVRTYVVTSGDISVPSPAALTVEPGVVFKFSRDCGIWVNGSLAAEGTLAEPVVFTSWRDDTWGGDTNADGGTSVPVNGDWDGIQFNPSFFADRSVLSRVIVRYAGRGYAGGVVLNGASVRVENSEISHGSRHGIYVTNASGLVRGNRIWANAWDGLYLARGGGATATFNEFALNGSDGVEIQGDAAGGTFTNNRIFLNRGYGIRNNSGTVVDASQTWWGDTDGTGPAHATANPDGTGQAVTDGVTFDPWVTDPPLDYVYTNFSAGAPSGLGSLDQPTIVQGTLSDEWDPTNRSAGRTMVWHADAVEIAYTGLDPTARYRLYVTYFNGDPGGSLQSLTDGNGSAVHSTLAMPTQPTQFGFALPGSHYATGGLTLRFVHDNPDTSLRASVSEVWIVEETGEVAPPLFDSVAYNDVDGSGGYSVGDELWFTFTQAMDTSLVRDGTTDADLRLPPDPGATYGDVNAVRWSADQRTLIVTLT